MFFGDCSLWLQLGLSWSSVGLVSSSPTFAQWDSSQECLKRQGQLGPHWPRGYILLCGCFASVRTIWGYFSRQIAARLPNLDAFFTFSMCLYLCNPRTGSELGEGWGRWWKVLSAIRYTDKVALLQWFLELWLISACHTVEGGRTLFLLEKKAECCGTSSFGTD